MKKNILYLASLLSVCFVGGALARGIGFTNYTPFKVRVTTKYAGESIASCRPDVFDLEPGQRKDIRAGSCLLLSIDATITEIGNATVGGIKYQPVAGSAQRGSVPAARYASKGGQSVFNEWGILTTGSGYRVQYCPK